MKSDTKKENKSGISRNTAFEVMSCSIPTYNNFCKAAAALAGIFALYRFPCRCSSTTKANGSTPQSSFTATLRWIKKSSNFLSPFTDQPNVNEVNLIFLFQSAQIR